MWWICNKGHEWETTVNSRTNSKSGCPYCSGKNATKETSLATVYPHLINEWHETKNNGLTPYEVTSKSNKKVWWQCSKGHEWEAMISNRGEKGNGCPYCSGKKVYAGNNLATIYPHLINEWHETKNNGLTPYEVTSKSNKKVWWHCTKGHEWETKICHRSNGTGCPYCTGKKKIEKE